MPAPREARTIGDRYVVEAPIGRGGMGEVVRARDLRLDRVVALKLLPAERIGHGASVERLVREARATAALEHPAIVRMYDVGATGDGGAYLAMELVRGRSLRAMLEQGPLAWADAAPVLLDVARALAHAHGARVVHRDVKPDNVIVRDDGRAVVLDFGLAKLVHPESAAVTTLTAEGAIVGTPAYLAPEQALGRDDVDARADQFAFGVLVYETLVGSVPWSGATVTAVLAAVLTEPAPAIASDRAPPEVIALVARLLTKEPSGRFASMDEVVARLERVAPAGASAVVAVSSGLRAEHVDPLGRTDDAIPSSGPGPLSPNGERIGVRGERSTNSPSEPPTPHNRSTLVGRRNSAGPGRARIATWILVGLVALVAAAAGVLVVPRWLAGPESSATVRDASQPRPRRLGLLDQPAPRGCTAAATSAYTAGVHAIQRGDWDDAHRQLERAARSDPHCAAAQLRHALVAVYTYRSSAARESFGRARVGRANLDPRLASLLDAYDPMFRDPPDADECSRRIIALARRSLDDAEVLVIGSFDANAPIEERTRWARTATDIDPRYSDAWQTLGMLSAEAGRTDEALRAFDRCAEVAPLSVDCGQARLQLQSWLGRCEDLEPRAREMRARSPRALGPAHWLARALAWQGRPRSSVEDALARAFPRGANGARDPLELWQRAALDAWLGRFDDAVIGVARTIGALGDADDPEIRIAASALRIDALRESGKLAEASVEARDYLARRDVWLDSADWQAFSPHHEMSIVLAARGALDPAAFDAELSRWRARTDRNRRMSVEERRWIAEAQPVVDEPEARRVVARWGANVPPAVRTTTVASIGRVLLLAGRAREAAPLLRRAADGCLVLEHPFLSVHARLWLGDALEANGDRAGACEAWSSVVARWRDAVPPSVTVGEARRRMRDHDCATQ